MACAEFRRLKFSFSNLLLGLAKLLHVVAMVSPLVAIGALVVLTAVAESASLAQLFASYEKPTSSGDHSYKKHDAYKDDSKRESHEDNNYDHDYKMKKQVTFARTYKHEPQYKENEDYYNDDVKQESHEDNKYDHDYKMNK